MEDQLAQMGGITGGLVLIGAFIKNKTPLPNKWIPLVTLVLGVAAYVAWSGDLSPRGIIYGLFASLSATGLHSGTVSVASAP